VLALALPSSARQEELDQVEREKVLVAEGVS
jgi:hypothetical protein